MAKDSDITGDAHTNGAVALAAGVLIDGDLSAAGNIALRGATVTGTVTPFAPSQPLPVLPSAAAARALADRVFEGNRSFAAGTVIDDVVFVAGQARFLGSINGTGTVIAGGQIRFDNVSPGQPAHLEPGTRMSFVSLGSLWVGKDRKLRGELVAGGAAELHQGLELQGLVVARGSLAVQKDAAIMYSPPGEGEDVEPPVITPVSPEPGEFVAGPAPLVAAAFSDDGSGVDPASARLLVNGVDSTSQALVSAEGITWVAAEPLAEGLHPVTVRVSDLAGNPAEVAWSFTVDLTPPSVAVVEPAAAVVIGTATPAILVTYDDALSGIDLISVEITIDGAGVTASCAVGPSEASCTAPLLDAGAHTVVARVRDRAGHAQEAERTFLLVLDAEAPVVTITTPEDGAIVNTPAVEVTGTATDDGVLVSVGVNGVEAALTGDEFNATVALEDGFNGLLVVATDASGNEGIASRSVLLDTVPPELRVETPASGQVVNGAEVRVAGQVVDARGVALVRVNGEDAALEDGRFEAIVALAEGANLLAVTAFDRAGNVAEETRGVTRFTLPEVAIASPEDLAYIAATTVTVTGTVSEGVVSVAVNGVAATLVGDTFHAEGVPLIEGGNTVTAAATDSSGRVATATIHLVRDLTPPRVAIYRPAVGEVVHEPTIAVSGLVNDIVPGTVNAGEATVTVNGIPAEVANRSFFVAAVPLVSGENTLVAAAEDTSGNAAETRVTVHYNPTAAARVRVVSGNHQIAAIGSTLPSPLVVELLDATGQPVAGRPVVFSLRGNNGGLDGGRRRIVVVTGAAGRAEAHFTLGTRAGVANQVVEASAAGFASAVFTATALAAAPELIVVDSGSLQDGIAGRPVPRPLIAAVVDRGHNRLEGVPVRIEVIEGAGHFAGGARQIVVPTDSDGRAIVTFTLDPEEGIANNVVEASIEAFEDGPVASFVASGRVAGPAEETSISGVVLDNTNLPIAGATLRIKETVITAETDVEGQFRIAGAPVGAVKLIVDGSTVDRPGSWPDLEYDLVTIPGRDNTVNMPIYLLPLDLATGLFVDETHGGTLTLEDYPGFALEIAPGSVTFPGGGRSGHVSVTVVHNDKVPMVPNFGQQPRMIVTIQPAGARFEPPARLTLPNVEGLSAGQVTEMYSFDHDLGHFVSIGPATVSDDETVIMADPGVGIVKAGWHCGGDPAVFGTAHDCPECEICSFNRCVGIDGVECADDGDLCTLDGCSGGECTHTPKRCDDCRVCFLGDCLADPGEDGNLCNDNPCTRCDNGLCDPVLDGPITATANGASFQEVELEEPISFMATFDETDCPQATVRWNLGDGSFVSGNPITYAYQTDGVFTVSAEVRCPPCPAKRTASVAVAIYEVQMKLEKVETTISDDGSYSEDTEVRVTAVKSTSGEQLFDFTGTVQLEELTEPPIYTQNGGSLPTSVDISFSGTNIFAAKSLAGAIAEGHPPSDAQIRTSNFPLYRQDTFAIPQWIDDQVHDPLITGQAFDWFERRLIDIRTNASGNLAAVLAHVSGFVVESMPANGHIVVEHADQHVMHLNPYELEMRLDSDYGPRCGRAQNRLMSYTVTHEARHAYQLALSVQDLDSPEDLPGPPEEPNNDDDQDFLVDQSPIPPGDIFIDSTAARNVCQVFADLVFSISFSGDSIVDSFALRAGPALEYDAFTFAEQNAP